MGPIDPDTAVEAEEELLVTGDKPKKVCRSVTSLGSRVPQKICRTEKEAREEVLSTREMITERRLMGDKPTEYQGEDTTADGGFDSRVPVADPF